MKQLEEALIARFNPWGSAGSEGDSLVPSGNGGLGRHPPPKPSVGVDSLFVFLRKHPDADHHSLWSSVVLRLY